MTSTKVGEPITIEISEDERTEYLRVYATKHFRAESRQVMVDVLESGDTIDVAFAQAGINEMIIDALELAIRFEQTTEGLINDK